MPAKFPDFEYPASALSAYSQSIGIFIICPKDGTIVNFTPRDAKAFEEWLVEKKVRNINKDKGY